MLNIPKRLKILLWNIPEKNASPSRVSILMPYILGWRYEHSLPWFMVLEEAYTPHFVRVPQTEVRRRRLEDVRGIACGLACAAFPVRIDIGEVMYTWGIFWSLNGINWNINSPEGPVKGQRTVCERGWLLLDSRWTRQTSTCTAYQFNTCCWHL